MNVVVIVAHRDHHIGSPIVGVAAVCEDWTSAEQEKKRLIETVPGFTYNLIEKTLTKRRNE